MSPAAPRERPPSTPRQKALRWTLIGVVALAGFLVVSLVALRLGLTSGPGRDLVSGFVNGAEVGRYGRIDVSDVRGDLWDDFTIGRVTVRDQKGIWLEARDVRVDWNYAPLLARRFHADRVEARLIRVIRRPLLEPKLDEADKPLPLTIDIDAFKAPVELLEGVAEEYGRWGVGGSTELARVGAKKGVVVARSASRPGDFLRAVFSVGGAEGLQIDAEANEAAGGSLAGLLGFSPDRPFALDVDADGEAAAGRFSAVLRSGERLPLTAQGRWDKSGARANGRALLATSELTAPYAERIGREARFGLTANRLPSGRYAFGWTFEADNLTTSAKGVADASARAAPDGVRITLTTPSLTRLIGQPAAGATRYEGVFRGEPARWTLDGRAVLEAAEVASYRLGRASGPLLVSFRDGRYDIDAEIEGAGGGGSGLVAGLLGARPRAEVRMARLRDGRLLLERLEAEGAGLEARGSGSRGVGGGLSFRGEATLTDLSRIRPGAKGRLGGTVRATQSGRAGWRLAFDARGRRFASGLGQLDRLLGTEPRLRGDGVLAPGGRIAITEARLDGKAGRAGARGLIEPGGRMRLALDWSAQGPFAAGPVEIAGNARGSGALTGTFAAPRADLKARFDRIDLPQLTLADTDVTLTFARDRGAFDGRIAALGRTSYGPARARSDFRLAPDGVRLSNLDLDAAGVTARGSVALRRGAPSSADLAFAAGPGAFVESGTATGTVRLTDGGATTPAAIDVTATDLRPRGSAYLFRTLRLQGAGTLSRLPFTVQADVAGTTPVVFNGNGLYARSAGAQTISLDGQGRLNRASFRTNRPILVRLERDGGRSVDLDLNAVGGRLAATARQDGEAVEAKATLRGVSLGAFGDYEGRVDADLTMTGRGSRLDGTLDARLDKARSLDGPRELAVDGRLRATLEDDVLRLTASAADEGGLKADAEATLPAIASASPLRLAIARERPIAGRFDLQGQAAPVWNLLFGADRSLAGAIGANGTVAGTLNDPRVTGAASVRQGRFVDSSTGLVLTGVNADVRFDDRSVLLQTLEGMDDAGGRIAGQGRASLVRGGSSNLELRLDRFQLIDNDLGSARASGPVTLTRGADGDLAIVGDLRIVEAEIEPNPPTPSGVVRMDVIEINRPDGERRERPRAQGPQIALRVDLTAPRGVYVRGRGLDVELSLDARVRGTTSRPDLSGVARVIRGDFEFSGKRFVFDDRGSITLDEQVRNIRLDLRAVRDDPTLTATIAVTGTAAEPDIELSSTPNLPDDEILSQILFGRSASQLSAVEAAQLAAGVASLSGGGGFDVFGNLREFAGLDRLSFAGDAAGGFTVAGGKYVSEDVYLELIGGGQEGPAVQVEWRPRRNLGVLSRFTGQGNASLSVRWRREFR